MYRLLATTGTGTGIGTPFASACAGLRRRNVFSGRSPVVFELSRGKIHSEAEPSEPRIHSRATSESRSQLSVRELPLLRYLAVDLGLRPTEAISTVEVASKFKRKSAPSGCKDSRRTAAERDVAPACPEMEAVAELQQLLADVLGLGLDEFGKIVAKYPLVLCMHAHSVELLLEFLLDDLDLSRREIARIVGKKPELLCYGLECFKSKMEYLQGPWGGSDEPLSLEEVGKMLLEKPQLLSQPILNMWVYEDMWDSSG